MTITVNMSKEEFLDYNSYNEFKNTVKCGIIDLEDKLNSMYRYMLEDAIWSDKNKYDKLVKEVNKIVSDLKRGVSTNVNTKM